MAAAPDPPANAVLIVDDHMLVATSLMLSLRSQGLPTHHCDASGGATALAVPLVREL